MNRFLNIFVGLLMASFLYSCSTDVVYEQIEDISESGWSYNEPVRFNFTAPDTSNMFDLIFDIRITPDYGYQNLWLYVEITDPDGKINKDSINCPMAYPDGRWIGSGLGDLIDNPVMVQRNFKFTKPGEYQFAITHGMRHNVLPHVRNVGVILKSKN